MVGARIPADFVDSNALNAYGRLVDALKLGLGGDFDLLELGGGFFEAYRKFRRFGAGELNLKCRVGLVSNGFDAHIHQARGEVFDTELAFKVAQTRGSPAVNANDGTGNGFVGGVVDYGSAQGGLCQGAERQDAQCRSNGKT